MPEDDRPTHLAIIFDKSEITFRNKLYPDYKAHRPPAPDDLIPQFALIREAVRAFDLPCLEQGGFEADDLIATYARLAGERGATTTIVSSDKDLMQLVTDKVTMYDTMKDRRIGIPEVIESALTVVATDLDDLAVRPCPDLGEPAAPGQHGRFTREHPRAERHHDLLGGRRADDIDPARHDDEKTGRLLARLHQHLAPLDVAPVPVRGDAGELWRRQRRIDVHRTPARGRGRGGGNECHGFTCPAGALPRTRATCPRPERSR